MVVFHLDIDAHEDQLIAEVPHALYSSHSALCACHSSRFVAAGGQLRLFSWLQHGGEFRLYTQKSDDLANITRLPPFGKLVAEDDIDRPGHGSRGDLGGIFLHADLLEIGKGTSGHLHFPAAPVAIFSGASFGLGVLELLDNGLT